MELQQDLLTGILETIGFVSVPFAIAVMGVALATTFGSVFTSGLKRSLRVAVVGSSRAGKTSLITVLFDHIMSGRIARYVSVSGTETIDRITAYQKLMAAGTNLGPSSDKDVFAYRYFTSRKRLGILPEKVDVEIADFPGEYTEELGVSIADWASSKGLYKKEFFSWIVRADRYIFVVDLEPWVKERAFQAIANKEKSTYTRQIEIVFKNAIMQLKQELLDESLYNRPALLAFTKSDLLLLDESQIHSIYDATDPPLVYQDVRLTSAAQDPETARAFEDCKDQVIQSFSDFLDFLKNNFRRTDIAFHSSYLDIGPLSGANAKIVKFATPFQV